MRFKPNLNGRNRVAAIAGLGIALSFLAGPRAEGDESISTAPNFTGQGLDGKTYELASLLEKGPVFLDFWTTWCKPCLLELPELAKLQEKYGKRGFTLLTVASDDRKTAAKIKPLAKQRGFEFPILMDSKRTIGNQYNVRQYPTSYLIAQNGKIAAIHVGYRPGDEISIEKELLLLLPEVTPDTDSDTETDGEGGEH